MIEGEVSKCVVDAADKLRRFLGPEFISKRPGEGGKQFSYVEGHQLITIANEVFGFDGWSNSVKDRVIDYKECVDGKWILGVTVVNRVILSKKFGGVFHEDVGFGEATRMKTLGMALEKATKEAATDALKRCFRFFGESLGNCIYNKVFLERIARVRDKGNVIDFDENRLYRLEVNEVGKRRRLNECSVKGEGSVEGGVKKRCLGGDEKGVDVVNDGLFANPLVKFGGKAGVQGSGSGVGDDISEFFGDGDSEDWMFDV